MIERGEHYTGAAVVRTGLLCGPAGDASEDVLAISDVLAAARTIVELRTVHSRRHVVFRPRHRVGRLCVDPRPHGAVGLRAVPGANRDGVVGAGTLCTEERRPRHVPIMPLRADGGGSNPHSGGPLGCQA